MPARRCEECDIDFPPKTVRCEACSGPTAYYPGRAHDPDWEARVAQARGFDDELARIVGWRCHVLLEAGCDPPTATEIAARFQGPEKIDTHDAIKLIKAITGSGRPTRLVAEILL
jgi:hypothetical protein